MELLGLAIYHLDSYLRKDLININEFKYFYDNLNLADMNSSHILGKINFVTIKLNKLEEISNLLTDQYKSIENETRILLLFIDFVNLNNIVMNNMNNICIKILTKILYVFKYMINFRLEVIIVKMYLIQKEIVNLKAKIKEPMYIISNEVSFYYNNDN